MATRVPRRTRLTDEEFAAEFDHVRRKLKAVEGQSWLGSGFANLFAERLQDGLPVLAPSGVHLYVNPALCTMVGFGCEEPVGTGVSHLYWPEEERERLSRPVARERRRAEIDRIEATFVRRNGERPALPMEEVAEEIRAGLGVIYDAEAGTACLELLEEGYSFGDD